MKTEGRLLHELSRIVVTVMGIPCPGITGVDSGRRIVRDEGDSQGK